MTGETDFPDIEIQKYGKQATVFDYFETNDSSSLGKSSLWGISTMRNYFFMELCLLSNYLSFYFAYRLRMTSLLDAKILFNSILI